VPGNRGIAVNHENRVRKAEGGKAERSYDDEEDFAEGKGMNTD
jgi:hypothetical protein